MNDLERYFRENPGRLIHKCANYFDVYDRYFSRYRGTDVVLLEIGVSHGGSLEMWRDYFGPRACIHGVDVNPACKAFEDARTRIFIGSQADREFLRTLRSLIPPVDILIDDGGHTMTQQIATFEELYDHVKSDGTYLCEDLHTSYWLRYGGGHKRRGTFIEYSKDLIDLLNADHSEQPSLRAAPFTRSVRGLHFYNGMIVIEKGEVTDFRDMKSGTPALPPARGTAFERRRGSAALHALNSALRTFRLPGVVWR